MSRRTAPPKPCVCSCWNKPPRRQRSRMGIIIMSDIYDALAEHIGLLVKIGFDSRQTIIDSTIELFRDDYDLGVLRSLAPRITDELLLEHHILEKHWTHETDCDK